MCGIVGYIGNDSSKEIIIKGLEKLEYRGYDSAGIALLSDSGIEIIKSVGKIAELNAKLAEQSQKIGIGHTRWATHGIPNDTNSHPHYSTNKLFTLVHNGIIENYLELKETYLSNKTCYSQTDTEIIANLLEVFVESGDSVTEAIKRFISVAHGSYALAIIYKDEFDKMYVAKNKAPMLIGLGNEFNMLASDALALYSMTKTVLEINDEEFGVLTKDNVLIMDKDGNEISRASYEVSIDASDVEKGIYPHYMLKEMYDQPSVIRKIVSEYLPAGKVNIPSDIIDSVKVAKRLHIIAAGTSYFSGLVSKSFLEKNIEVPVEVHIASEFTYDTPIIEDGSIFIFITQSGETADLRAALLLVKGLGFKTITITNAEGSTLAREADSYILLHAGREISVASTKAFVAQLTTLAIIGYAASCKPSTDLYDELSKVALAIENIFENRAKIEELSKKYLVGKSTAFYIGRGVDYKLAMEGALKIKEISYIHTEAFAAGELKHGTIALIDDVTPVVAIITQGHVELNTRSSIMEVEARGANVMTLVSKKYARDTDSFVIEDVNDDVVAIAMVVVLQLLAYYTALHMDKDIDMPRNLAKSVTVE